LICTHFRVIQNLRRGAFKKNNGFRSLLKKTNKKNFTLCLIEGCSNKKNKANGSFYEKKEKKPLTVD
jgi:hypothetical protein